MKSAELRFPVSEIARWAGRYQYATDQPVQELVPTVRARGYLTKAELLTVVDWKAPRARRHQAKVSKEIVIEATTTAFSAHAEELRMGILTLIPGVGYPMASVILHFFHADRYPIIDYRAMWSLGLEQTNAYYTFDTWWSYVEACRRLALAAEVDMRTLDRALWQFSKENQPS